MNDRRYNGNWNKHEKYHVLESSNNELNEAFYNFIPFFASARIEKIPRSFESRSAQLGGEGSIKFNGA